MSIKPKHLTQGDLEIMASRTKNPDAFNNWYFRSKNSGTWYKPDETRDHIKKSYRKLVSQWEQLRKPQFFGEIDNEWKILTPSEYEWRSDQLQKVYRTTQENDQPSFFLRHGFIYFDWQRKTVTAPQLTKIVVGGFGSGKSVAFLVKMLGDAATIPGFTGLIIAPYSLQVQDLYNKCISVMRDTLFYDKFFIHKVSRPYPEIHVGSAQLGVSKLFFIPVLDDPEKVKTLEADSAMIDQTEQFTNILGQDGVLSMVTSRLRGIEISSGRERIAESIWIANAADNIELWEFVDRADEDPANYYFSQPTTYDNLILTGSQLSKFEREFGRTEEEREVNLKGMAPLGSGEHFSRATLQQCHSQELDDLMKYGMEAKVDGFVKIEMRGIGVQRWEMPPADDNPEYVVAADPGWGNPPARNSPAISVWRIDGFPKRPAQLTAFHWVFGNNSPDPWMDAFMEYVHRYSAYGKCIYDATGAQRGYARLTERLAESMAWQLDLGNVKKETYLTLLKMMMARGVINFPRIPMLTMQMSKYEYPESKKAAQDLVSMMIVLAAYLEMPYKNGIRPTREEPKEYYTDPVVHRYRRPAPTVSRFHRPTRGRR